MIDARVAKLSPTQRVILSEKIAALTASGGDQADGERLVAHVVLGTGKSVTPAELRAHLSASLPAHMVPEQFNFLPKLPETPNGKTDRRALASMKFSVAGDREDYVAPRDEMERTLCTILADILDVRRVGTMDDFFDLGGHSLHVIRAVSKIRELLGVPLRVPDFFALRTVERLADHFRAEDPALAAHPATVDLSPDSTAPSESNERHPIANPEAKENDASIVVPIQVKGARPPLFIVHGAMGAMVEATRLSDLLGPEQPVYAVCAQWKQGGGPKSFEEMAAAHIGEIVKAAPRGPYALMGFCYGGNLAYEIARQLAEQGRAVSFLGIIEAAPRVPRVRPWWEVRSLYNLASNITYRLWGMRHRSPMEITLDANRVLWRLRARFLRRTTAGAIPPEYEVGYVDLSGVPEPLVRLREERIQLLLDYQERPYPGKITLMRSKERFGFSTLGEDLGWSDLAACRIVFVGDSHEDLLEEPHIIVLAEALKKELNAQD